MALFSRKSKPPTTSRSRGGVDPHQIEQRILDIGKDMLVRARSNRAGLISAKFLSDRLMAWSMRDHGFKVQLFRFVDAFPVLTTPEMVHEHLLDYLTQPGVKLPPGMDLGLRAGGVAKGLMASTISGQIRAMASKFIAGENADDAMAGLQKLWNDGIAFSVDLLGEACVSDAEADAYRDKYLELVRVLHERVAPWQAQELLERDHLGPIPRANVSVKISSLSAKCDPIDPDGAIRDVMTRLGPILTEAGKRGVFINFDMEQSSLKDLTLTLFERCCETYDFQGGIAMQAYLRSGVDDAQRLCDWARRTGRIVTVRLVKGAYWDYETIHSEQQGWPCEVWPRKWQTDQCFERMAEVFLDACPRPGPASGSRASGGVKLALGSHNVRSIAAALAACEVRGLPWNAIELQMLHGMADELKAAAVEMGLRIREYVPVGDLIPGMAYLVRRLLENTSNESWLRAGFVENMDPEVLLAEPKARDVDGGTSREPSTASSLVDLFLVAAPRHRLSEGVEGVGNGQPFFTEPTRDFSKRAQREAFAGALARAVVPRVANDRTPDQARAMIGEALGAFPAWRDLPARTRAAVLTHAAAMMRDRRDELSGIMVKEAAKTWREADADVCEAIDFCEYYARLAVPIAQRSRLGMFLGELNEQWHEPRGVAAVISPWNFPLAICCGMTTAALVTGNTVIVKPAEQTPGIAKTMCEILWASMDLADVPSGLGRRALHFCPAPGETTGAALVRDPRIALIAFTGSKAVGLDIIQAAGVTPPEQEHVKKVICEMGGKNAVIIDASADLDEAVLGVRQSAFGFQGQKCSACSRVIVVDAQGEAGPHITTFIRRFVEATRSLVLGDPSKPGTDVGPVIDEEAADRIRRFIETASREGCRLELALDPPKDDPFVQTAARRFVGPHIFSGVKPTHTIAREEIFGPVVAVMHAATFDEALALANGSMYKLTGGVFTRKPSHIERTKREFRVGNLYINRGITGALVGRQPFGGFGMSGVGSKAGGAEYILQFVEPRVSCENTMRRGFSPEL